MTKFYSTPLPYPGIRYVRVTDGQAYTVLRDGSEVKWGEPVDRIYSLLSQGRWIELPASVSNPTDYKDPRPL